MSNMLKPSHISFDYDKMHYSILTSNGISNIIVGLIIFSIFIAIFYFTYAAKIEEQILNIQIKNLVENLTENLDVIEPYLSVKSFLAEQIQNLEIPDLTKEDEEVESMNKGILMKAVKMLGIFAGVMTVILIFLKIKYKTDIFGSLKTNFIILIFIALTEILFLNMIAKNYISLDTNQVKLNIMQQLQKFRLQ